MRTMDVLRAVDYLKWQWGKEKPVSLANLARRLKTSEGTLKPIIRELEAKQLVARAPTGARGADKPERELGTTHAKPAGGPLVMAWNLTSKGEKILKAGTDPQEFDDLDTKFFRGPLREVVEELRSLTRNRKIS